MTKHVHELLNSSVLTRRVGITERRALSRIPDADAKAKLIVERLLEEPEQAMSATALARAMGIAIKDVPLILLGLDLDIRRGKRILYAADPEKFRPVKPVEYRLVTRQD